MKRARMVEQADAGRDGFRYQWILEGVFKSTPPGSGWQWVRGVGARGCWVTKDLTLALALAVRLRVPIESNGTHAVMGAPMSAAAMLAC